MFLKIQNNVKFRKYILQAQNHRFNELCGHIFCVKNIASGAGSNKFLPEYQGPISQPVYEPTHNLYLGKFVFVLISILDIDRWALMTYAMLWPDYQFSIRATFSFTGFGLWAPPTVVKPVLCLPYMRAYGMCNDDIFVLWQGQNGCHLANDNFSSIILKNGVLISN